MVTLFPQMVCTQALCNVIGSERYDNVSDQVIRYVLGSFGSGNDRSFIGTAGLIALGN